MGKRDMNGREGRNRIEEKEEERRKRWRKEERDRGLPQCLFHAWLALQLFPGILPYRLEKLEYNLSLSGIPVGIPEITRVQQVG